MTLDEDQCWARLALAGHGVLATVHARRGVDAVPVVFVVSAVAAVSAVSAVSAPGTGPTVLVPIDAVKPKRSSRLQRLVNIERDPRCVLLVQHYEEEWSRLWWVRIHARATWAPGTAEAANLFADRFAQYRQPGSVAGVIVLHPTEVTGWRA